MIEDDPNYRPVFADTDKDAPPPVSIERTDNGIDIEFADGKVVNWSAEALRSQCPCATCREQRRDAPEKSAGPVNGGAGFSMPILSVAEAAPTRIASMQPVGSYGYNISFSDGHRSGIFRFAMLHTGG